MTRLVFVTGSSALAAGVALLVWAGGSSIAAADLRQGFVGVNVVHIVGEQLSLAGTAGGPNSILPLSVHEDKWLRAKPFATFEEMTMPPSTPAAYRRQISAGNADHRYWYFVDQNRVKKSRGLPGSFLDLMMATIQPDQASNVAWKQVGKTTIDGRNLDLLVMHDGDYTTELAVDPVSHRTYRLRDFRPGSVQILNWNPVTGSKLVEVANLRFYYDQAEPKNVFDWQPPKGAVGMTSELPRR